MSTVYTCTDGIQLDTHTYVDSMQVCFLFIYVGFIVQATLIIFMGFWITHLLHMFYSIAFPFRANRFIKSHSATRRAHFIEAFVIITLGLLMGSINISTSGYWFTGFPQVCEPASLDSFFYSQLIPFAIGGSTAILTLCLLVLIVRNVSFGSKYLILVVSYIYYAINIHIYT